MDKKTKIKQKRGSSRYSANSSLKIMQCVKQGPSGNKKCRISWLTNSAFVYGPTAGEGWNCGGLHRSPSKLGRSNSIFNIWCKVTE